MKKGKSAHFKLTANEILTAVGNWLIKEKYISIGEYDRIVGIGLEGRSYEFHVYKDDEEVYQKVKREPIGEIDSERKINLE